MKLKSGTIKHLQDYMESKINEQGFEGETIHERLILLMKEVGELARAYRKQSGMHIAEGKEIKNEIGEELTDVINMVFAVGVGLGIDIEKEFIAKEIKNDSRRYSREKKKPAVKRGRK